MPAGGDSLVSPWEHTAIGAAGGVSEVILMQPMVAFKNALQEGRPLPRTPVALYRGLLVNMGSIAPITATQFGTNRIAEQWLRGLRRRPHPDAAPPSSSPGAAAAAKAAAAAQAAAAAGAELSGVDRFACAAFAGGVSAAVATPTELIIIQQQKRCAPLSETVRDFAARYRAASLFRGLGPCVGRETLYAAGYLGLCPVLYDALRAREDPLPAPQAMAVAGVVGGVFAAAASHPFDTVKTRMQAHMYDRQEYLTSASSARAVFAEGGALTFWRGLLPRMTRIIAATFILINVRSRAVGYLEAQRGGAAGGGEAAELAATAAAAAAGAAAGAAE